MTRFFTPLMLLGTGVGAFVYNLRPDQKLVFPFLDRVVQAPETQGHLTVAILIGLGGIALFGAIIGLVRERSTREPDG